MNLCPQTLRHSVSASVCLLDDTECCFTTTASESYVCLVIFYCCSVQVTLCDYEMYSVPVKCTNLQNVFEDCITGKYPTSRVPCTELGHNFPSGLNKITFTPELWNCNFWYERRKEKKKNALVLSVHRITEFTICIPIKIKRKHIEVIHMLLS